MLTKQHSKRTRPIILLAAFLSLAMSAATSAQSLDSDNDGLSDADEIVIGTDPFDPDTDNDSLMDGTEVDMAMGTGCPNPLVYDSDGDGLSDGSEVLTIGTNPCNSDTDGDGIPDNIDPRPLDSGTIGLIEAQLRGLALFIRSEGMVPASEFIAPNANATAGRRNRLSSMVQSAANQVKVGNYGQAVRFLEAVLKRVDGVNLPGEEDWMRISSIYQGTVKRVCEFYLVILRAL